MVYEKSEKTKKSTYDKPVNTIAQLQKESEKAYSALIELVNKLISRQGYTYKQLELGGITEIEIDEQARAEAAALIAEDGILGVEAVSDRIVNFAIAISGGDEEKLDQLKEAIQQGFKQVENILGQLPEISIKTYERIMEKLDNYNWE